jgi:hypothetical protein
VILIKSGLATPDTSSPLGIKSPKNTLHSYILIINSLHTFHTNFESSYCLNILNIYIKK